MCYIWHLHRLKCIIIIIQWTCTTVIVPHSLINRNHGIDKQLISLIIQLDFLPWIYIIIITTDLSHEIASLSPPPGLHSIHTPSLSNFSNLSFVLHLHACMHTRQLEFMYQYSHMRNREGDPVYISVLFVLLPLSQSLDQCLNLPLILSGF